MLSEELGELYWFSRFYSLYNVLIVPNGLGLGEGGELEVQMFNLAQMFIRIPYLKFCTKAPLLPNPC